MGVLGALFTGITGLNAHSEALSVIGANIANVSTVGYKTSRVAFEEVLRGVTLRNLGRVFSQGAFEATSNITDLAISGDGFFILSNGADRFYSRAGQFAINANGNMVSPAGFIVQGFGIDDAGNVSGVVSDINLNAFSAPPKASDQFSLAANLNASALDGDTFGTSFTVFNSKGGPLSLTLDFVRNNAIGATAAGGGNTGDDTAVSGGTYSGANTDTYTVTVTTGGAPGVAEITITSASGNDNSGPIIVSGFGTGVAVGTKGATITFTDGGDGLLTAGDSWTIGATNEWGWSVSTSDGTSTSTGTLEFDSNGLLSGPTTDPTIIVTGLSNGAADLSLAWDIIKADGSSDLTGFDAPSATFSHTQNGHAPGSIQDISIGEDGLITGIFSNGIILPIYQVALADFPDQTGLTFKGNNLFQESSDSGQPVLGQPNQGGLGKIETSALELSNTDLTNEFVNLIAAQRGFQANTKVITVGNEVLLETVNLIR